MISNVHFDKGKVATSMEIDIEAQTTHGRLGESDPFLDILLASHLIVM